MARLVLFTGELVGAIPQANDLTPPLPEGVAQRTTMILVVRAINEYIPNNAKGNDCGIKAIEMRQVNTVRLG